MLLSSATKILLAAAGGALLTLSFNALRRAEAERAEKTPRAKPEPLQRWEGEGGAVPVSANRTAQQVEPHVSGDTQRSSLPTGAPTEST